ncbi:MAG: putative zinc-binding protein [Oleispira antarctica]|uniref:Zinc-binding protein n=1 Tax=Oleispira antarctica RB-8 TaxID=698738 RepID=R4YKF3_OLEAN|nr:putative zinc-binding protein [Oleispira antarctica]MBQ0791371.1 putative zinc-binding protein [Oleispira antarctica]CCK74897.1 conserved hypothetical protein [Oleispira antarctica RB-8]
MTHHALPLIYSCSGCSNVAQLANSVAVEMSHNGLAEMSCIAGVGGGVKPLVRKAQSNRTIIALDGCILHCVKHCLANQGVAATHHMTLSELDMGLKKRNDTLYDDEVRDAVIQRIERQLVLSAK